MSIHKADVYWSYASFYVEARLKEFYKEQAYWEEEYIPQRYGLGIGIEQDYNDFYAKVTAYIDELIISEGKKLIVVHTFENPNGVIDFYAPDQVSDFNDPNSEEADLTLHIPYEKVKVTVFLTGELSSYDLYFEKATD